MGLGVPQCPCTSQVAWPTTSRCCRPGEHCGVPMRYLRTTPIPHEALIGCLMVVINRHTAGAAGHGPGAHVPAGGRGVAAARGTVSNGRPGWALHASAACDCGSGAATRRHTQAPARKVFPRRVNSTPLCTQSDCHHQPQLVVPPPRAAWMERAVEPPYCLGCAHACCKQRTRARPAAPSCSQHQATLSSRARSWVLGTLAHEHPGIHTNLHSVPSGALAGRTPPSPAARWRQRTL